MWTKTIMKMNLSFLLFFFELIQYTENSCFSSSKPIHTFTKSFDRLKDYNSDIGNEKKFNEYRITKDYQLKLIS